MTSTARKTGALILTLVALLFVFAAGPTKAASTEPENGLASGSPGSSSTSAAVTPPLACGALSAQRLKALDSLKAGGGDCSLINTTIDAAYNPIDVINIPVVVHVVHNQKSPDSSIRPHQLHEYSG